MVGVAQLVEGPLPTPEVCGSNHVIGKIYSEQTKISTETKLVQLESDNTPPPTVSILCKNHLYLLTVYLAYYTL